MLLDICKNMTKANEYISNIIKSYNIDEIIKDQYIYELLEYHPTKKINMKNIEWLKFKKRPPYNTPAIYYKYINDDLEDDLSWRLCIKNYYNNYKKYNIDKKNITDAFRSEIYYGNKKKYFINNIKFINNKLIGKCNECNKLTEKICVDHYIISFNEILDMFIKNNNLILNDIEIYENSNNELRLLNKIIAQEWLNYHDNIANYRLLCISCNSSFGNYNYNK